MIQHYPQNERGTDYIVGDLHGCFSRLRGHLNTIGFDPALDRLFAVGDLVDRGPESFAVLEWLAKPWFHSIRGNHEQTIIDNMPGYSNKKRYLNDGATWFAGLSRKQQHIFADVFATMPIAITLETDLGPVGIVHAECPVSSWNHMLLGLQGPASEHVARLCLWSRTRGKLGLREHVADVRAVVVGHTMVDTCSTLGNVIYIDTGGVEPGREFTILNAATLMPVSLFAAASN